MPSMINLDPPEHTRRRRIVSSGFTPRRVAAHEEFLRQTVVGLMDRVADAGDGVTSSTTWPSRSRSR